MSGLETEQKPSRHLSGVAAIWIAAAVGALALHVGGAALAIVHLQADDTDESLGAPGIEVGLELMSSRAEPTYLPAGPDPDASPPPPALPEPNALAPETATP